MSEDQLTDTIRSLKAFLTPDYEKTEWYTQLRDDFEEAGSGASQVGCEQMADIFEEYCEMEQIAFSPDVAQGLFAQIDLDKDGKISLTDLYAWARDLVEKKYLP